MARARGAVVALAVLAGLATAACTAASGAGSRPVTTSGDAARCPGDLLDVVVSVSQWSDLAHRLGGDCATVTTVLASSAVDPHDYEPKPADIAAFEKADLVVLNGAGYDTWAADAVRNLDPRPAVVTAAGVAGWHAGDNPHLWYDPDLLPRMAGRITAELSELGRDDADVFTAQAAEQAQDLQPYTDELLRDLKAHPPKYIIYKDGVYDSPDLVAMTERVPEVNEWILANYRPAQTFGKTELLERAEVSSSN